MCVCCVVLCCVVLCVAGNVVYISDLSFFYIRRIFVDNLFCDVFFNREGGG